jgi:hypothetical protein
MSKAGWFTKGKEGRKKAKQENEAAKSRGKNDPWRVRLKNDESGVRLVFLDNPDFFLREHTLKMGPKKYINETCIQEFDNCSPCDHLGDMSSYEVVCSVIDTRSWKNKKEEVKKNQKKLLVCKSKARDILLRRVDQNDGNLQYCVVEFARGSAQNECGTGEDIVFLKKLTKKQVLSLMPPDVAKEDRADWIEPFEYEKVFAPKTAEELRKLYGGSAVGGDDDETGGGGDDEAEGTGDDIDDLVGNAGAGAGDVEAEDEGADDDAVEFAEDELRDDLEDKSRKGLEKFIKEEELEITFKKNTKDATLIEKIINAMKEVFEAGGGDDADETGGDDDAGADAGKDEAEDELSIDDLI